MCDLPEFTSQTWHTCNGKGKPRKCFECGGPIVPGQAYHSVAGKWNGVMDTFRSHKLCKEISDGQREAFRVNAGLYPDEMPAFGEMVESAREDADNTDDFPEYWPRGVFVSKRALAAHVAALTIVELATARPE